MTLAACIASGSGARYRPSVLVRLFIAVERLPFGGWWIYAVLYLALGAYQQVALWLTGERPVGTFTLDPVSALAYGPFLLGATHYMARAAARAMDAFRPVSGLSEADFTARRYELVALPAGQVWLPAAIGSIIGLGSILTASPAGLAPYGSTVRTALIVLGPAAVFGYGVAVVFFYQSLRQLRGIARLLDEAPTISLFDTSPLYAFSRLTAGVGLIVVFSAYYAYAADTAYQVGNALAVFFNVAAMVLGVVCFVVPLLGVHGRLVDEKNELARGVNTRFGALQAELYGRVDGSNLGGAGEVTSALAGLETIRGRIERLPTWPWPPALLRGFITAIVLPIVVYLLTRYASSVVG
jgi:hypothetical protein